MTPYEMSAAILHYAAACLIIAGAGGVAVVTMAALFNLRSRR